MKTKLEQIQERALDDFTYEKFCEYTIYNNSIFRKDKADKWLKDIITEVWNEAIKECEGGRPDTPTHWASEPMTQKEAEIYVQGMYDLMMMIGCDGHCKHYDPLFFEGGIAHSYVLELDDGGRHHSYITPQWVALKALLEFADSVRSDWDVGSNEYYKGSIETAIAQIEESTPAETKHYKR